MKALVVLVGLLAAAPSAYGQTLVQDQTELWRAQVVEVVSSEVKPTPGTNINTTYQTLRVELLEGPRAHDTVTVDNDYLELGVGETFYILHTIDGIDGHESYAVSEPYRVLTLLWVTALFLACLFMFGGWQGLRGLLALCASIFFIVYLLLPGILSGYPPLLVSLGAASLIIVLGSYVTHGFNRTTSAAVLGMLGTILVTGLLAYVAVTDARLSGFSGDEVTYLNFGTQGQIDLVGLLLGSILIGLLGVLYDAAIGQSVTVEELLRAGGTRAHVYSRALRVGREHIGALINTLAIAYVGAALPLILLFKLSYTQSLTVALNQELFATELLRIMVGSIGLILAVPITTTVAVYLLHNRIEKAPHRDGEGQHRH